MANTGGDTQYQATLDISQVIANLRKMQSENEKTAKAQERAYQKSQKEAVAATRAQIQEHQKVIRLSGQLEKSLANEAKAYEKLTRAAQEAGKASKSIGDTAQLSSVKIGAIGGVVAAVTTEFINLGKQAISTLANIAQEGVALAAKLEVNKGLITNILGGNEEAGQAVTNRLIEKGSKIGLLPEAAVGLGTSFLPDVGSLEQLDRIIEASVKLKTLAPEKSIEDIRQALEQGLSGDALALQDRLNLPPEVRTRIKELQAEFGKTEGLLKALDEVFGKFGIDLEDVSNTAIGKFGEVQSQLQKIQLAGSEPVLDALKEQLDDLGGILNERSDDFELIAAAVGDVTANVIDFIGGGLTDFLTNLDTDEVLEIVQGFFDLTEKARELAGILDILDFGSSFVDNLNFGVEKLNEALTTAIQITALAKATAAQEAAQREAFAKQVAAEQGGEGFLSGVARLPGVGSTAADLTTQIGTQKNADEIRKAGEDAYRKSLEESLSVMNESTQRTEENRKKTEERRKEQEKSNKTGEDAAQTFLKQQKAASDAAKDADKLVEAQEKVNEAMGKAEKDFQRELEDIDLETERKRMDILTQGAQAREDQARKNLQKIADIQRDNQQAIADAATDLNRKEEDIARKFANERIDLERENRQKRVDVEKDYRQKLEDIQSQSDADLEDAERSRDAVAFLRIVRQRQQQVQEAQTSRNRDIEELRLNGEQRKEELKVQQAREQEEAQIANERKLEDLRVSLERRLEEQRTANEREFEDIRINEARKLEELALSRERDIADAKLAHERKLEDLRLALAEELAMIEEFAAKKAAAEAAAKSKPSSFNPKYSGSEFKVPAGTSRGPGGKPAYKAKSIYGFANGGAFTVGGSGGTDSQLVQFMASPGERVMISPPTGGGGASNTWNNQREINAPITLADPNSLSATQRAIVRAEIMNILGNL